MSISGTQNSFMNAIDFTAEDLDTNRGGYMHEPQRLMLSRQRRRWSTRSFLALGLGVIVCVAIVTSDIYGSSFSAKIAPLTTVIVLNTAFAFGGWFRRRQFDLDLKNGNIHSVVGKPRLTSFNRAFSYTVRIQEEWFEVTKQVYSAFKELDSAISCRVYYAPNSKTIMSVEVL